MNTPVMKKSEVAEYFGVDEKTVDNWTKDGVLTRLKTPVPRWNRHEIEKLAGVNLTPTSPLERRRLKREIEEKERMILELQNMVAYLQGVFNKMDMLTAETRVAQVQKCM